MVLPLPEKEDPKVTLCGVSVAIKYLSLICLVVQNSALVLTMRYSRTVEGPMFAVSTAVVVSEFLKMISSLLILLREESYNGTRLISRIHREVWEDKREMIKVAIPAVLYTIQNNLQYVAATHLDAATFQVTYQLKILTTALFSVILLHKSLTPMKWGSLVILTFGVACVQLPPDAIEKGQFFVVEGEGNQSPVIGLFAVLTACFLSGLAGVYFEKILKDSPVSVWVRNVQLGFYGVIIGLMGVFLSDWETVSERGFFYGYQFITVVVILNQALGGLLVAVVVKYADNILKGYATSISIILSSVASIFLFAFQITGIFVFGTGLVIVAVFMYA